VYSYIDHANNNIEIAVNDNYKYVNNDIVLTMIITVTTMPNTGMIREKDYNTDLVMRYMPFLIYSSETLFIMLT